MTRQTITSPIIVAIDKANLNDALTLADSLDPSLCRLKVGKELFTACGAQIVQELHRRDFEIFLDLKFHDIPNTTAQAVLSAADMGVWMTNIHASVGSTAMALCIKRLTENNYNTKLIAVTVLTSMNDEALKELGVNKSVTQQVMHLAKMAYESGLGGVVCSAHEATLLKQQFGKEFELITPGIRLTQDSTDDQQRICTPTDAIKNGSDYLVIGRSITMADSPSDKLQTILEELKNRYLPKKYATPTHS